MYTYNCELTLFFFRAIQLPLLDSSLTSSLLVVHSFIHSFTIHFPSTFNVTNIILGAGCTKINGAHTLLRAAHGFFPKGRECDNQLTGIPNPMAMIFYLMI